MIENVKENMVVNVKKLMDNLYKKYYFYQEIGEHAPVHIPRKVRGLVVLEVIFFKEWRGTCVSLQGLSESLIRRGVLLVPNRAHPRPHSFKDRQWRD